VDAYASGLEVPWEIAFAGDGTVFVTERPGRVRIIKDGHLRPEPALTLNVVHAPGNEGGLLGLALHPQYPNPPDVFLYYTYRGPNGNTNRVARFTFDTVHLTNERVILDGIRGGVSNHFGGRIAFGPDGLLYITTGEGFVPARAADRASLDGKVLRIREDGSIPPDNPFGSSPVYAWGFRNPQGLAWDPAGHLYASNHGPSGEFRLCCHDEVDLVQAGGFYGWPVMAGNVPAGRPGDYPPLPPSRIPTVAESGTDTWAPSGMTFYAPKGELPTLLLAMLRGQGLRRFILDPQQPGRVVSQEVVLSGYGRLRDAVAGPDGCLYVLTSNRDGRGSPQAGDDRVLKACPE